MTCNYSVRLTNTYLQWETYDVCLAMWLAEGTMVSWACQYMGLCNWG